MGISRHSESVRTELMDYRGGGPGGNEQGMVEPLPYDPTRSSAVWLRI